MIKVFDRYLYGQLFWSSLFAVVLFSIIWLAPETLFKLTQYVFGGNISLLQACKMFLLHLPAAVEQCIPVALLLGALFVFQRMSGQFEVVALNAAGISPQRIVRTVMLVGLTFAALAIVLDELVLPITGPALDHDYTHLALKDQQDRNFIFVQKNKEHQLSRLFLIGQAQENQLSDFIVLDYRPATSDLVVDNAENSPNTMMQGVQIEKIMRAKTGRWASKDNEWQLVDGIEYRLNSEGVYEEIKTFTEAIVPMSPYAAKLLSYSTKNPKYLDAMRMAKYIGLLGEGGQGQDIPYFEVLLNQKLVAPLAAIFFSIVGALLGMERIRSRNSYGLVFGAILIFVYSVMMPFSTNIAALIFLPVWVVAWFPLFTCILVAWILLMLKKQLA